MHKLTRSIPYGDSAHSVQVRRSRSLAPGARYRREVRTYARAAAAVVVRGRNLAEETRHEARAEVLAQHGKLLVRHGTAIRGDVLEPRDRSRAAYAARVKTIRDPHEAALVAAEAAVREAQRVVDAATSDLERETAEGDLVVAEKARDALDEIGESLPATPSPQRPASPFDPPHAAQAAPRVWPLRPSPRPPTTGTRQQYNSNPFAASVRGVLAAESRTALRRAAMTDAAAAD